MSKQQANKGLAFKDATPEQLKAVEDVIDDHKKHRYRVSRIYTLYNAITGKNENPQTCSSCLRARAKAIQAWFDEGKAKAKPAKATKDAEAVQTPAPENEAPVEPENVEPDDITPVDDAPETDDDAFDPDAGLQPLAIGVHRIPMQGEETIDFTPNEPGNIVDGSKGLVSWAATGKKVNAGTYKTAQGHLIKVQVGGKGTFIEDLAS